MRKEIPDHPGYFADEDGRIYSTIRNTWHELHQTEHNGFYDVQLRVNGKKTNIPVHRLMLTTFVGPKPKGCKAIHLNHDPLDNRLDNLCWDTCWRKAAEKHKKKCMF